MVLRKRRLAFVPVAIGDPEYTHTTVLMDCSRDVQATLMRARLLYDDCAHLYRTTMEESYSSLLEKRLDRIALICMAADLRREFDFYCPIVSGSKVEG